MTTEKESNIRKQLTLVRQTLLDTIQREREYEKLYLESRQERSMVQAYYNTLEIKLAELENTIQRPKPYASSREKKHITVIDEKEVMDKIFANLTPEQISAVVAQLRK